MYDSKKNNIFLDVSVDPVQNQSSVGGISDKQATLWQSERNNMKESRFNFLAAAFCAVGLSTGILNVAHADVFAFAPIGGTFVPGEPSGNDALFFTPTVDISVTALGYFDNPLVSYGHQVGLYQVTSVVGNPLDYSGTVLGVVGSTTIATAGNLLASSTITGSGGSLDNSFYYNAITPVTLLAGQLYAVSGYYAGGPDMGVYADGGVGADPLITYDYYLWDYNAGADLPTNTYATGIFGPNFAFVPVPEPTTMMVFGAGAALLLLRKKRVA